MQNKYPVGRLRWIFSYHYVGEKKPGETPAVINQVQLTADYAAGLLAPAFMLSMHVIIPGRLGQRYFVGVDISPGAKTYLEFSYKCRDGGVGVPARRDLQGGAGAPPP